MGKQTKLSALLIERDISSKDVVNGAKLNKTHMSLIKNGYQNITMGTLKKLCKFFKCSPNDILDWEGWNTEKKTASVKK